VISWTPPADNGSEILTYILTIRQTDGTTFSQDLTDCDAQNNEIVSASQCTIPLATLTTSPFSLSYGESVYARVVATNIKGDSVESDEGNGAIIITKPDVPENLLEDTQYRTESALGLVW
jgi:hypothetical protein